MPPLPFQIDRSSRLSLTRQLVDGFRRAIAEGRYGEGDILPSIAEITATTGVCPVAVRSAIKRLAAEGLVNPRQGIGTVVLGSSAPRWKGHVAILTAELYDNFSNGMIIGHITRVLMKAGYLVTKIPVLLPKESPEVAAPTVDLLARGITFAVVFYGAEHAIKDAVVKARIPFVTVGGICAKAPLFKGNIAIAAWHALPEFSANCHAAGVRTITEVHYVSGTKTVQTALRNAGFSVSLLSLFKTGKLPKCDSVTEITMAIIDKLLAAGREWLPDVLFCSDNIAAEGTLLALLKHGIRIPEDVGLVTWMPKGDRPVFWKSMTRLETDPKKDGEKIGQIILRVIAGGSVPSEPVIRSVYKVGETFPPVNARQRLQATGSPR